MNNKDWETCGAGKEAKRDDRDRHCVSLSCVFFVSFFVRCLNLIRVSVYAWPAEGEEGDPVLLHA